MKKSMAFAMLTVLALSASSGSAAVAADNAVVAGAKKVGTVIVWPFKKLGQGLKAVKDKVTGK